MFIFLGGNTRSIIGDRDDRPAIDVFGLNHHFAPGAAMLDRIIDEVADGIKDQVAIAGRHHLAVADDGEAGAVLLCGGIV